MTRREMKRLTRSGQPLIKLHVLGAAQGVTGSLNLFEIIEGEKVTRFLLDVGLTVENEGVDFQNRLPSGIKPHDIDFVIVSHAHLDHSGYLPKLFKDGFHGPAYTTDATKDLLEVLLPDSGFLQEEAAKRANKRCMRKRVASASEAGDNYLHPQEKCDTNKACNRQPLYTREEAVATLNCVKTLAMDERHDLGHNVALRFTEAGHILGSAVVNLELGTGAHKRTFCFTGNIGRTRVPLLKELAPVKAADYLMSESTYGNKLHVKRNRLEAFADIINNAHARALNADKKYGAGVILIPAFAVGRAQIILSDLRELMSAGKIPTIPVYVDSPMTLRATEVHSNHAELFNDETRKLVDAGINPFRTPRQTDVHDWQQSAKLQEPVSQPMIVVGSSGMASGGRIVQHLAKRLPGKQNTVIFVGYQGTGTLGQALVRFTAQGDGRKDPSPAAKKPRTVNIAGKPVNVSAVVEFMGDYSGHADAQEILNWLSKFQRRPKNTFLVHGDPEALDGLKTRIERGLQWTVTVPKPKETFILS